MKTVSLGGFLMHARKNPGTLLVSYYDFRGGRLFLEKLRKASRNGFEVQDYYGFCCEHELPFVFLPPEEERQIILKAKNEWAMLRKNLADEFSRFSLDCYLETMETRDTGKMVPAFVEPDYKFFNRITRKFSPIPHDEEIFVDVGGWDGDTVVKFVDTVKGYKAIHSYEPLKAQFEKLKKREFYLNNFYPHPEAASNITGEIEFAESAEASRAAEVGMTTNCPVTRIPCVKLDDVLEEMTLLKVEVEGHEVKVIEGAAHLIKTCVPDMAINSYHLPLDPIRIFETVARIRSYKYIAFRLHSTDPYLTTMYFSNRMPFE